MVPVMQGTGTPADISLPLTRCRSPTLDRAPPSFRPARRSGPRAAGRRPGRWRPVRSISGSRPRDSLCRPMRISGPVSRNRRSGQYPGNWNVRRIGAPGSDHALVVRVIAAHHRRPRFPPGAAGGAGCPVAGSAGAGPFPVMSAAAGLRAARPAVTAAPFRWPVSKSNPQVSQKRPELAAPQRGQGSAGPAGSPVLLRLSLLRLRWPRSRCCDPGGSRRRTAVTGSWWMRRSAFRRRRRNHCSPNRGRLGRSASPPRLLCPCCCTPATSWS